MSRSDRTSHVDSSFHLPATGHEFSQNCSPSSDDDHSLWMPPKAKDRTGLEAEEVRPHAKIETKQKLGAVLHSMDLIVDGKGFLVPRKAKSTKDERTIDNECYLYGDEGDSGSSFEESTSEDSSSQEEVFPGRKNNDSLSSIPYSLLMQDDAALQDNPKTPSKASRQGMTSFSTLETEAMTRTPSTSHRTSFLVCTPRSSFQSPPHTEIPRSCGFVGDLVSPLRDDPSFDVYNSKGSAERQAPVSQTHSPAKSRRSSISSDQRRVPYSSPVISKSRKARVARKMVEKLPFHSPQQVGRPSRPSIRRCKSESRTEMLSHQHSPKKNRSQPRNRLPQQEKSVDVTETTDAVQRSTVAATEQQQSRHSVPITVDELLEAMSTLILHEQTQSYTTNSTAGSRKKEHDTCGRSRGTLSTEGATLSDSTGRKSTLLDSGTVKNAGDMTSRASLVCEEEQVGPPPKSTFIRRKVSRVDANGFPIWGMDIHQEFPIWGLNDRGETRTGGGVTNMDSGLCSDAAVVFERPRKMLVVKEKKVTKSSQDKQPSTRKSRSSSRSRRKKEEISR